MAPQESRATKVQTSYQKLAAAAATLNAASNELGIVIADLDAAIKSLNLGISSWLNINNWTDEDGDGWNTDQMGYARIGGKWGIALRKLSGSNRSGEEIVDGEWLFNDAPRALRMDAIGKIPDFLENLAKDADEMTKRVNERLKESQALAKAIKTAVRAPGNAGKEPATMPAPPPLGPPVPLPPRTTAARRVLAPNTPGRPALATSSERAAAVENTPPAASPEDPRLAEVKRLLFEQSKKFVSSCLEHLAEWRAEPGVAHFIFSRQNSGSFWADVLNNKENQEALREVCSQVLGEPVSIRVTLRDEDAPEITK